MRTVYVDVLIVVNMVIDWIMLLSAGRLLKLGAKPRRVLLGGAVGSVCSLAALLPKLAPPVNLLLDIGFAALMVFTAYGRASPKITCSFISRPPKRIIMIFQQIFRHIP